MMCHHPELKLIPRPKESIRGVMHQVIEMHAVITGISNRPVFPYRCSKYFDIALKILY